MKFKFKFKYTQYINIVRVNKLSEERIASYGHACLKAIYHRTEKNGSASNSACSHSGAIDATLNDIRTKELKISQKLSSFVLFGCVPATVCEIEKTATWTYIEFRFN